MFFFGRKPKSIGERGEDLAVQALKREGYRILGRNVQLGRNEVDILAREGDTIAFVEVKTRRSEDDAHHTEDNITPAKQRKLAAAARWYISQQTEISHNFRFDVVTIVLADSAKPQITIYRDAFRA